jgi:hypothetical protein
MKVPLSIFILNSNEVWFPFWGGGTGVELRYWGTALTRQVLYCMSHAPRHFCFGLSQTQNPPSSVSSVLGFWCMPPYLASFVFSS